MKLSYIVQEISSRCDAGCQNCFRTLVPVTEGNMSREVFEASLAEVEPGTMVCGALHGESLLHPDFLFFLNRWKEKGLKVGLPLSGQTTNYVKEIMAKESPVYSVLVSADGYYEETQAERRGNIPIWKVDRLIGRCLAHRQKDIFIGVRMIQHGQSEVEFENFLYYLLFIEKIDAVLRANWTDYTKKGSPRKLDCRVITEGIPAITWDGDVLLCERVPDRKKYVLGNVLKEPLSKIWERRRYMDCCDNCGLAIVPCGMKGVMQLRHGPDVPIYVHNDHYQTFYSLKKDWSGITWKE